MVRALTQQVTAMTTMTNRTSAPPAAAAMMTSSSDHNVDSEDGDPSAPALLVGMAEQSMHNKTSPALAKARLSVASLKRSAPLSVTAQPATMLELGALAAACVSGRPINLAANSQLSRVGMAQKPDSSLQPPTLSKETTSSAVNSNARLVVVLDTSAAAEVVVISAGWLVVDAPVVVGASVAVAASVVANAAVIAASSVVASVIVVWVVGGVV